MSVLRGKNQYKSSFGELRSIRLREVSVLKCPSYRGYFNRKCITFIRGIQKCPSYRGVRLKRFDCPKYSAIQTSSRPKKSKKLAENQENRLFYATLIPFGGPEGGEGSC